MAQSRGTFDNYRPGIEKVEDPVRHQYELGGFCIVLKAPNPNPMRSSVASATLKLSVCAECLLSSCAGGRGVRRMPSLFADSMPSCCWLPWKSEMPCHYLWRSCQRLAWPSRIPQHSLLTWADSWRPKLGTFLPLLESDWKVFETTRDSHFFNCRFQTTYL